MKRTIQERFAEFHAKNPEVYTELERLALAMQNNGWMHGGIGVLWEVARWNLFLNRPVSRVTEDALYKLNNNYRSRYARMIMESNPDLDGFFELRRLRA